jgi:hypothetical protein
MNAASWAPDSRHCSSASVSLGARKVSGTPYVLPSTHTQITCSSPWTARTRSTACSTRPSSMQPRSTPPLSLIFFRGRTPGPREFSSAGRLTTPFPSSPLASSNRGTLRPLLFTLTLQGPLQRTSTAHPATQIIAYFDDINVVGPAAAAASAFEALAAEVRTVSLTRCAPKAQRTARTQIWQQLPQMNSVSFMRTRAWLLPALGSAQSSSSTSSSRASDKTLTTSFSASQISRIPSHARTSE